MRRFASDLFFKRSWAFSFFAAIFLLSGSVLQAQTLAFPGAEGSGRSATGGRGTASVATTVFEVTNLSDDGLPGSLRYALTTTATYRTVVFRVSGTIHLNSRLNIKANTTLAGQTAPGQGICVADYPVVISGDNVIVRYMRFRLGDKNQKKVDASGNPVDGSGGDDAFGGMDVNNVIIDHCSISWSNDEALTIYRGDNVTVQWSFITEPLNYSYHFETGDTDYERHGYGGIWGGKHASFHHNLLAHCHSRNPRFAGISSYSPATVGIENADLRNNIIYNWGINTVYGGEGGNYNVVNNYYKYGPSTSTSVRYRVVNPSYTMSGSTVTIPYGKWYVNGNFVDGSATNTANNWRGAVMQSGNAADTALAKATTPHDWGMPVSTHTAQEAYEYVLQGAGCNLPQRDTLDQRLVLDVRNRTGRIIDVQGGYPHGTPYATSAGAWPALSSSAPPADDDHDGMPNSWETSNGLNPADAGDRSLYAPNGYTNIENYLNSLTNAPAITSASIFVNGFLSNFAQTIGSPSASQTFLISGINLTSDITLTPPVGYELSADNGSTWKTNASPLVLTQSGGTVASTTITVRLNAGTTGSYTGNITATSAGAFPADVPVNGSASTMSAGGATGSFPGMDGGFEAQLGGSRSGVSSHTSTTKWEASSTIVIDSAIARTGEKSMHWNQGSTSNKYLFSPVLSGSTLLASTQYMVQFWYRLPAPLTGNPGGSSDLKLYGYTSTIGLLGGTSTSITAPLALNVSSPSGPGWSLYTAMLTTTADAPTTTFAGMRVTYPQSPYFDIDDYVVYPGNTADNTAPDAISALAANGNAVANTIDLSWSAPATGVDGGGYLVVRSNTAALPVPNPKGVYVAGNSMGTDAKIVYTGVAASFSDADVIPGATYYYTVFAVDKAFNYASAVSVTGVIATDPADIITTGSLSAFTQNVGTASATQTYTVAGNGLTAPIAINAPTGYEISMDGGTSWTSSGTAHQISPSSGTVAPTTISVRLNAGLAGSYAGNITHSSNGATTTNVVVNGTATSVSVPPAGTAVTVAKDGSGNFTSIQAAIDAAPAGLTAPYIIYIKNGKYREKVLIPSNKPFIQLIGESVAYTILSWDDYSGKAMPGGGTYGTSNSYTLGINATDCLVMGMTIENTTGDAPQALAINVNADRVVVVNCRLLGGQDTILTNGSGRQYFKNCYVDGTVDFIFGSAKVIFDSCVIYPKTRQDGLSGSYITAANTPSGQAYGYVFRDCIVPANLGVTSYVLGRPWQNDGSSPTPAHNKVVLINPTYGQNIIAPAGWSTWSTGTNTSVIYYGEYRARHFDSSLVDISQRVPWSYQLTAAEAATYTFANIFGSWDPCTVAASVCAAPAKQLAVSNFQGKKGTTTTPSKLSWNISWPMASVNYELYRSTDNSNFSMISQQVGVTDTAVNFTYTDPIPPAGSTYYYYVKASKAGQTTHITDTIRISSTPTITVTGSLTAFLQGAGAPSASQAYQVSGVNLPGNITITAPAEFEISSNGGSSWNNSSSPITMIPTGGAVANTTISVRLNAATAGTYSGDIIHASSGADTVRLAASGTVQSTPLPVPSIVLQWWPMTTNSNDSAAVRDAGVTASTPSFNNYYLSNGTTVAAVAAYSTLRGQAFGASTNGDGSWGTATGGPGGNLNRVFYEQFTVTALSNQSVKVDSILLTTAFYNSSSNTKLAMVWSKSGFVADSANVTGGTGPAGALLSTANGGFTTPILLANQTAGPTNNYALALNGTSGVSLNPGETLTFRIYFSCGSTSTGRYAQVKNVIAKGVSSVAPPTLTVNAAMSSFTQTVGVPSTVQTYTVSGSALSGNVTIMAPSGYEVSADGSNWFNNSTSLVLVPVNGAVSATISVRLNAATSGNYNGDITHVSSGANTINVSVTGLANTAPSIAVSGSLNAFSQTLGTPSAVQTYTVSGAALTSDIVITAPAGYEISATGGASWTAAGTPLVLMASAGSVANTTISIRLNATAAGSYAGDISHTSSGASTVNKPVSGTTVLPPSLVLTGSLAAFTQTVGTPSAVQTYTISGADLTGNITIVPPVNYQVSANGGTNWFTNANPLVLNATAGALATTTISVRLNAIAAGSYAGNITHTTAGGNTPDMAVSGTVVPAPLITVSSSMVAFAQTLPNFSTVQTYTVSGSNLTGNITLTAPAGYELSSNGGTSWSISSTPIVLNATGGTVTATTISVRLNAAAAGSYAGSIAHTSAGAATVNASVTGTTVLPPGLTITASLTPFRQTFGSPSSAQSYTIAGNNLVGNVTITPPVRYQLSLNNGSTWSSAPLIIVPVAGSINANIMVRLNAAFTGVFSGNITHASSGLTTASVAVTGTNGLEAAFRAYPVPTYQVLFISHPVQDAAMAITLFNSAGQRMGSYHTAPHTPETRLQVGMLPAGVYTIHLETGSELKIIRFVKQ